MRIRITAPTTTYWNYEVRAFAPGEELTGAVAEHLADNSPDTIEVLDGADRAAVPPAPPVMPPEGDLDIDAKADVVLAWVGDDPQRAAAALAAETAKDKPRSTLVKGLEKLAAGPDTEQE